ncbi:MAG: hypothetical protein BWX70_02312 [Verrucomicrobia bacterium ADurb.Bin070]|nr:MAG: hypothetical protein BWX70_02312 [Verrucomicrobia bacterium ADurb.Bin070]
MRACLRRIGSPPNCIARWLPSTIRRFIACSQTCSRSSTSIPFAAKCRRCMSITRSTASGKVSRRIFSGMYRLYFEVNT